MKISFQNTKADFAALFDEHWGNRKRQNRENFYRNLLWYLAVIALGTYVSYRADEIFAVCVFLVLGVFYTSQNWSHERYWQKQREDFAVKIQEREATLTVDDTGLTGSYSEIVAFVPWKHIREYTLVSDYLFIHFRGPEIFVIPLRYISTSEKESLMDTLSTHGIRAKLTSQPRS